MNAWEKAYALAQLVALAVALFAIAITGTTDETTMFVSFIGAISLAGWFGGTRPALFTTWSLTSAVSLLAVGIDASGGELFRISAYLGSGALISLAAGAWRPVRSPTAELVQANATLTEEVRRRQLAESVRTGLLRRLTTAQEDERSRIARELHDQMGQYLAALGVGLRVIAGSVPPGSAVAEQLARLREMTEVVGREAHRLAVELRPAILDDVGLEAAARNYLDEWSDRAGVETDFCCDIRRERLARAVETTVYRILQEALTNVLKHAEAKRVGVVLRQDGGELHLIVEDDGRGFDSDRATERADGRLGLLGMAERVSQLAGRLAIDSEPGRGTTVVVRIPVAMDPGGREP